MKSRNIIIHNKIIPILIRILKLYRCSNKLSGKRLIKIICVKNETKENKSCLLKNPLKTYKRKKEKNK